MPKPSDETTELAVELAAQLEKMPPKMQADVVEAIKDFNRIPSQALKDQAAAVMFGHMPEMSRIARHAAKAEKARHKYEDDLVKASPEDPLVYTYLMSWRRLNERLLLAQEDEDRAARWFRWTGLAGLALLILAILIGLLLTALDRPLPVAFITAASAAVVELLAAVFALMWKGASRRVDKFDDQLRKQQNEYPSSLRQRSGSARAGDKAKFDPPL